MNEYAEVMTNSCNMLASIILVMITSIKVKLRIAQFEIFEIKFLEKSKCWQQDKIQNFQIEEFPQQPRQPTNSKLISWEC